MRAPDRLRGGAAALAALTAQVVFFVMVGLVAIGATPVLFGWRSEVITTASMSPALRVGDIVVAGPVRGRLVPGQVVAVRDPAHPGLVLVHRLVRLTSDGGLITRGDANPVLDSTPVARAGLLGVGRLRVPRAGVVTVWIHRHQFLPLAGFLIVMTALGWVAVGGSLWPRTDQRFARHPLRDRHPRLAAAMLPLIVALVPGLALLGLSVSALTGTTSTLASLASATTFPTYPQAVTDDSPLVYYRQDEADGATAATDSSGNGTTGVYEGSEGTFQQTAAEGTGLATDKAFMFSGQSQVSADTNATVADVNSMSEEVWFKTSTTAGGELIGWGTNNYADSTTRDRYIQIETNGALSFVVGTSPVTTITSAASGYNNNAWHYVVATIGTGAPAGMRLYVDGSQVASNAGITDGATYTAHWRVGGDTAYYHGLLDEAAVYTSQLSAARISAHYSAGTGATTLASYTSTITADAPWSYFHLNDVAAAAAAYYRANLITASNSFPTEMMTDSSGNGNDGVYHNVRPISIVGGTAGALVGGQASHTAMTYGPGGAGYDPAALTNPLPLSLELWFKTSTTTGGELMTFADRVNPDSSSRDRILYMQDNGQITFGVYPGSVVTVTSPASYNDGAWHYLVVTLGAAGLDLYLDNVMVASSPGTTTAQNFTGYWRWAGDTVLGWPNRPTADYFDGVLDEIAIYSTQLSAARIRRHWAANH